MFILLIDDFILTTTSITPYPSDIVLIAPGHKGVGKILREEKNVGKKSAPLIETLPFCCG